MDPTTAFQRPGILFLGPRHSGKTSILRTIFNRYNPSNTVYLTSTSATISNNNNSNNTNNHENIPADTSTSNTILPYPFRMYNITTNTLFTYNLFDTPGDINWTTVFSNSYNHTNTTKSNINNDTNILMNGSSIPLPPTTLLTTKANILHYNDIVDDIFTSFPIPTTLFFPSSSSSSSSSPNTISTDTSSTIYKYPLLSTSSSSLSSSSYTNNEELNNLIQQYIDNENNQLYQRLQLSMFTLFHSCKTIILVIDIQDENSYQLIHNLLSELKLLLTNYYLLIQYYQTQSSSSTSTSINIPLPQLEIFLHKMDNENKVLTSSNNTINPTISTNSNSTTTETRTEILREWSTFITNELNDLGFRIVGGNNNHQNTNPTNYYNKQASSSGSSSSTTVSGTTAISSTSPSIPSLPPLPISVSYYLTSIYDQSIHEAMSRVIQKVTPGIQRYPYLESLCNNIVHTCRLEKIFLLDTVTRLYHLTDSTPLQEGIYELVMEAIDVAADVALIYDPYTSLSTAGNNPDSFLVLRAQQIENNFSDAGRCTGCTVRLSDGTIMYAMEILPYMMVICIIKDTINTTINTTTPGINDTMYKSKVGNTNSIENSDYLVSSSTPPSSLLLSKVDIPLPRTLLSINQRSYLYYNLQIFLKGIKQIMMNNNNTGTGST